MLPPRVIIALSDREIAEFFPQPLWGELEKLLPGYRMVRLPLARPDDWTQLWRTDPADILIGAWQIAPLNSKLKPDLSRLRYLCYLSGAVRRIIPRELIERGLIVTNWGSTIGPTIAECALMLVLMALRRASYWAIAMHRDGAWREPTLVTQSLIDRRVGIHGFGASSQRLVTMLRPFTSHIQAYSPRVPDKILSDLGVKRTQSLDELFAQSDVVVELAAGTPENFGVVTEKHLRSIPEGGVFVNVGKGSVVDQVGMLRVAQEGRLQIALDVYEVDPLPADSPLRGLPNVTLLPHLAGPTPDRRRDSGALALKNLRAYLRGEPMEAVVTLGVYDRSS